MRTDSGRGEASRPHFHEMFSNAPHPMPAITTPPQHFIGNRCSAGSRLLVERSRYEEMLSKLGARFAALKVGPAQADLDCGPLIRAGQLERVRGFLAEAERDGCKVVAKGTIVADAPTTGFYIEPHLIRDVPPTSRLGCDEVFGPVLAAMPFADEADAVRIANATDFGLVAGVWTRDGGRQLRMARAIRSGQVFINNYGAGGAVSSCRSAASNTPGTVAKKASRRCTALRC